MKAARGCRGKVEGQAGLGLHHIFMIWKCKAPSSTADAIPGAVVGELKGTQGIAPCTLASSLVRSGAPLDLVGGIRAQWGWTGPVGKDRKGQLACRVCLQQAYTCLEKGHSALDLPSLGLTCLCSTEQLDPNCSE